MALPALDIGERAREGGCRWGGAERGHPRVGIERRHAVVHRV